MLCMLLVVSSWYSLESYDKLFKVSAASTVRCTESVVKMLARQGLCSQSYRSRTKHVVNGLGSRPNHMAAQLLFHSTQHIATGVA
jgi:hypothetical protein